MDGAPLIFALPGSIHQRTGGTIYDRRIVEGLRCSGQPVQLAELPGAFPVCDTIAKTAARHTVLDAPDDACLVIDGLALPGFVNCLADHHARLRVTALVHHPLAAESGLPETDRVALFGLERDMLRFVDGIVTTSPATARMLVDDYDVAAPRIVTVLPGTDPAPPSRGSGGRGPLRLLCVASLIARKGHVALISALAACPSSDWRLDCLGASDRDPAVTQAIRDVIDSLGVTDRVFLHGEADDGQLAAAYDAADVFVLASELEGYGMAFAEALSHGLPVIGSGDGAVRDTVPPEAGTIVPVGDHGALVQALSQIMSMPEHRADLARGARVAGAALPDWAEATRRFDAALMRSPAPVR